VLRALPDGRLGAHLRGAPQELRHELPGEGLPEQGPREGAERGAQQQLLEVRPGGLAARAEGLLHPLHHRAVQRLVAPAEGREKLDGHLVHGEVEPHGLLHPGREALVAVEDVDDDGAQQPRHELPDADGHAVLVHAPAGAGEVERIVAAVEEQAQLRQDVPGEDP